MSTLTIFSVLGNGLVLSIIVRFNSFVLSSPTVCPPESRLHVGTDGVFGDSYQFQIFHLEDEGKSHDYSCFCVAGQYCSGFINIGISS